MNPSNLSKPTWHTSTKYTSLPVWISAKGHRNQSHQPLEVGGSSATSPVIEANLYPSPDRELHDSRFGRRFQSRQNFGPGVKKGLGAQMCALQIRELLPPDLRRRLLQLGSGPFGIYTAFLTLRTVSTSNLPALEGTFGRILFWILGAGSDLNVIWWFGFLGCSVGVRRTMLEISRVVR